MLRFLVLTLSILTVLATEWSDVDKLINRGISDRVYPGAFAGVYSQKHGVLYSKSFGKFSYGEPLPYNPFPPTVTDDSIFDMASCTKVVATTSAIAQFYERGELDLDMPLAHPLLLGPAFGVNGKQTVTSRHCLLHEAGFAPDPVPGYLDSRFGCPSRSIVPPPETFSCIPKIHKSLLAESLVRKPSVKYVYSDLSMMTLAYVAGGLARKLGYVSPADLEPNCAGFRGFVNSEPSMAIDICYFRSYVRNYVLHRQFNDETMFFTIKEQDKPRCLPEWNATDVDRGIIQGAVSDENSYSAGGVLGHAGLFSTGPGIMSFVKDFMNGEIINQTTINTFVTVNNVSMSSRALGWDTSNPDPWLCGSLSSATFNHSGYTGTSICIDPIRKLAVFLLTNRCYPGKTTPGMGEVRKNYGTLVQRIFDEKFNSI
ncbi:hypothetical protein RCL1_005756 [Eukaryota sp. TZLM3-RCL]